MNSERFTAGLLFIIAVVAIGAVLRVTGSIFMPLVIAVLLSSVFSPVVNYLKRFRVPRPISIAAVLLVFLAFGFLVGLVLYSSTQSLVRQFPTYQQRLTALLRELIERFDLPSTLLQEFNLSRTLGGALISFSGNFMAFVSGFTLVIIFLLFLLIEQPYVRVKLRYSFSPHTMRKIMISFAHINRQIGRYLAVKLFVSSLTGVIVFTAFTFIGVDFPIIWGILTFMFNFIPSLGSIFISLLASLFALLQFAPDWGPFAAAALSISFTQLIIGNIIDPKLLGDRLNLSPVIIILSLLVWGWLWGIGGMFLAVPLTVAIKLAFENFPGMKPVGIFMGTGTYIRRRKRALPRREIT
jgi:AI-2 transport protein TqsA